MHARVAKTYASTAVETARELGADLARLGSACGLPGLERGLSESIPAEHYLALLEAAAEELGDLAFGLRLGERTRPPAFPGLSLLLCSCKDYRTAAEQWVRFAELTHDLGRFELVELDDLVSFRWRSPWLGRPGGRHLVESVLASVLALGDWLGGTRRPLLEVSFTHAAPTGVPYEEYRRVFRIPVRFGAEVNALLAPASLLDAEIPNAETSVYPLLQREMEHRLSAHRSEDHEPSIVQAVRGRIEAHLKSDSVRLNDVARALGLTSRTLQRKLGEVQISYSRLLDATRREMTERYLLDESLSLAEIAVLLGFKEQSSFNHAFRTWFGTTPAAWRRRRVMR